MAAVHTAYSEPTMHCILLVHTVGVKKVERSNIICKVSNFGVRLLQSYFALTNSKLLECNFSITFELLTLQVRLLLSTFLTPTVGTNTQ